MKAARLYGPGDIRLEEVADPRPQDGQVLVKVEACGVCPSDIRSYYGTAKQTWTPGHEASGVLAQIVGGHSGGPAVGDRVAIDWRHVCGDCFYCLTGNPNFCERREDFQIAGFAEYTVVPQAVVHTLPPNVSFDDASFCEPLACVLNAYRVIHAPFGADVVVIGAGPVGLMHAQVALRHGARVIVVDKLEPRLAVAGQLGAHDVINASDGDPVAQVLELTHGYGAGAVVVAANSATAVEQAIAMARKGGVVNLFAGIYPATELRLDPNLVHYSEISLTGSHDYAPAEFALALRLIEHGIVKVAPLVSNRYPLSDIAIAFETARDQRALKSIIHPHDTEVS